MISVVMDFVSRPWVGTLLGLIGIIAALYFYKKSQRRPKLAHQRSEFAVVGGGTTSFPSDVEIRFGNHVVPRVTSSKLIIWNAGNETLNSSQVVQADKVRVEISAGETILQAKVISKTRDVNNFTLETESSQPNVANITFDYLDPGDGATLEILHTDSQAILKLLGTMRGLPHGFTDFGITGSNPQVAIIKTVPSSTIGLMSMGAGLMIFVMGVVLIYQKIFDESIRGYQNPLAWMGWALGVIGFIYAVLGASIFWRARRRYAAILDVAGSERQDMKIEREGS